MRIKSVLIGSLVFGFFISSSALAPHPVRFLIVRHGETDYNADGRVQGTLESQLTRRGREQASDLGRWLARNEPSIGRVAVSPKRRTMETLAGISAEHPALSSKEAAAVPIDVRPGLREIELTVWEGRKRCDITAAAAATAEMSDADGARWDRWKVDPMSFIFEEDGHAPLRCLWERAGVEWQDLRDEAKSVANARKLDTAKIGESPAEFPPTLVVAHGAFNRALMLQSLGLQMVGWRDDKEHFIFENCECVELEWWPSFGSDVDSRSSFAVRWRRRYPHESKWITRDEEMRRATETYLVAAGLPTPSAGTIDSSSSLS